MTKQLPTNIKNQILDMNCERETIGCSKAGVYRYSSPGKTLYLKIEQKQGELEAEYRNLSWLQGRLPVPEIIEWFQNDEFDYLLMSGLDGKMLRDDEYLRNPELAVSLLAEGINMIRSLDIGGCPIHNGTDKKLKDAEMNIERGSVDMDDWEDDNSFSSPEELLAHLRNNIPRNMETAFTHGDYCLPNILAKDRKITGFIDLGRAGVADPWQDVALCIRSLQHNFETDRFGDMLLEKIGIQLDRDKLEYHILLDELF